ncbi:hypothetical protein SacmaDRAFT_5192 [Saccharomonospora marina XMU15]|uniref:DUF3987 domain-containing protein n=1 Tax=Saccharomonospora marina XMU15 TaxID=882083 RepID=H5X525_9PSEU|nr:hypothetical protein SacmaDRAFT_5192 [Saccharomonospora marina XMU15]
MTAPQPGERHLRPVNAPGEPSTGVLPEPSSEVLPEPADLHGKNPSTGAVEVPPGSRQPPVVDPEARAAEEVARARGALPPLDAAAFDCYLGRVVEAVAEFTEGDPVNVLASLICVTGVHLGQKPHVRAGDDVHPLLVWPLIIGRTGSGRKGAGWSSAKRIALAAGPDFMSTNVRSGLTSGEGLAAMFADDQDADDNGEKAGRRTGGRLPAGDRRLLVFEAEWAAVMARMKREGNSLSATLRGAWEGGDLSTLAVSARIAPSSHVGIVAHITPEEFRAKVSASDLAGGTYNRFLPIMVARARFLPGGQGAPLAIINGLGAELAERLEHGGELGALGFTTAGDELWRRLYVEFGTDSGDSGPVEQFVSRAAPYCLRIAGIHAALDGNSAIDAGHLIAAAALVRYAIDSARAAFNQSAETAKLAAWIAAAGAEGRTREQVRSDFYGRNKKADEVNALLDTLARAGRITATKRPPASGRGRPTEVYTAVQVPRG